MTLLRPSFPFSTPWLPTVFAVLGVAAEAVPLSSPYRSLFPSFALAFAAFLLDGTGAAVWLAWLSTLLGRLCLRREGLLASLSDAGRAATACAAAAGLYFLTGGGTEPLSHWFSLSLVSPAFLAVSYGLERLRERPAPAGPGRVLQWVAAHIVLTAFGLLLASALILQGLFAFSLVVVALGAVLHLMYLQEEVQAANAELRTLHDTAGRLNATLRLEGVFAIVSEALERVIHPHFLGLFLFLDGERGLEGAAAQTRGEPQSPAARALWERLAAAVAARRTPTLCRDLTRDPVLAGVARDGGAAAEGAPRSLLAVPLLADEQVLGVIVAGHREPRRFHAKHLRLVTIMSGQVAAAIRNAILYEKTETMAITDHLTDLYNYRYLYLRLEEELRTARARGSNLSVIYLDLDRFKQCNDRFGHVAGDQVICEFARVLRQSIRQSDIPARYGGDEFVVILPATGRQEAEEVALRIREAVRGHAFRAGEGNCIVRLGVSAGVATFPEDGEAVDALISAADNAMYRDKGAREGVG